MKTEKIIGSFDFSEQSYIDKQKNPERADLNKLKIDVENKGLYGEYDSKTVVRAFVLKEEVDEWYLKTAFLLLLHCLNTNQKVFAVFHKFKEDNATKTSSDKTKIKPEGLTRMSHLLRRNKIGELNKGKIKKIDKK